jgi:hypothetical protein
VSSGAQKGDGAVDAPAHRDSDPGWLGRGSKDLSERVRKRVSRKGFARHGRRLEQAQPRERPLEALGVGIDDPIAVHRQPDECDLAVPR